MIKKLLTGLLVWLPILLVSFSNASYSVHSVGSLSGSPYQVWVLSKWNVQTIYWDSSRYVFAPINWLVFFWDSDSNPRLIAPNFFDCRNKSMYVYYYECDEITTNSITNCTKKSIDKNYLSQFMGTIQSNTDNFAYEYIATENSNYTFNLCFSSHSVWKSVCFKYTANNGANQWCYVWSDMTWDKLEYTYSSLPDSLIWRSPASPYNSLDDSNYDIIDSTLTNYQVLVGCEKVWLEYNYCKWWYDASVLFPNSWFPSLSWYVRWQWVDIITMYNMYSWTYNTPSKFMQAISKGYNIHDFDWFRWKPLALYMFAVQYFPNKDDLQFSFIDIYNYCQLFNDVDNWLENNVYTSDNLQVCKNQARIDKSNKFWDWYTSDWSGALSIFWEWTWFSSPDEFFWKIYSFFNTNLIYDWESYPWVLPPVIYFFMIAIIFIRIISRSNG